MSSQNTQASNGLRTFIKVLIFGFIIIAGGVIAWLVLATGPEAKKRPARISVPTVLTVLPEIPASTVTFSAMGTVIPARKVDLAPEVSGRIVWRSDHLMPGGFFQKGEALLRLDDAEYLLAVKQQQSVVSRAVADLALEKGQQDVAKEELALVQSAADVTVVDTELALRVPQLAQVQADLASARAALSKAELDLARTRVYSPFNAVITEKNIDLGTRVTTGTTMVSLVGTDVFWVEARIPADRLNRLVFPDQSRGKGSVADITTSSGATRTGSVIRKLPDLTESSRLARVLIQVDDPLGIVTGSAPLLLSEYVNLSLHITPVPGAVVIPRGALRDDNTVWVLKDKTLDIRPVTVVWKEGNNAWISDGLSTSDPVIFSDISSPVQGMPLKPSGSDRTPDGKKESVSLKKDADQPRNRRAS